MIDDGETFVWDVPSGEDPEYALLIATTIFCLMSNLMLPCFVSLGRRYEKRRIAYQLEHDTDGVEANVSEMPDTARDLSKLVAEGETLQHLVDDTTAAHHDYNVSINGPTSYIHGKNPTIPLNSGARSPPEIVLGAFDKVRHTPTACSSWNYAVYNLFSTKYKGFLMLIPFVPFCYLFFL